MTFKGERRSCSEGETRSHCLDSFLFSFSGGVMYARYLTLFTLTNNPAVKINIHDAIARGEVGLGELF